MKKFPSDYSPVAPLFMNGDRWALRNPQDPWDWPTLPTSPTYMMGFIHLGIATATADGPQKIFLGN
jgi:hypothetical protein